MKINDRPRRGRAGFTLIELLVVIAIIAVLVSLTAAAVMKFFILGPKTQTRNDISQMQSALAAARADPVFGIGQEQFPSRLMLREDGLYDMTDPVQADSRAFLMKMFKMTNPSQLVGQDWNGNGVTPDPPVTLSGDQCLVFFLGGVIYGSPPGPQGFCTLSGQPAPKGGGGPRSAPAFYFDPKRLVQLQTANNNFFYSYLDPYGTPYAYFSSYKRPNGYNRYGGSDCVGVAPYLKTATTYWNESSFQIISAGPDKTFGTGGVLWGANNPASGAGADDMSNFSGGLLGSGQ